FVYSVGAVLPPGTPLPDVAEGEIKISVVPEILALAGVNEGETPPAGRCFSKAGAKKVIVVGCGPAGLFAALRLAEKGIPVLLLERGDQVPARCREVQAFWETGTLNRESNVHFGEGGAGTFSDGKLTSRIKNHQMGLVKETLVELGAPPDILIDAKPHIGTDRLRAVVVNFRQKLLSLDCEIRFGALVSDFMVRNGRLVGVVVNGEEEVRVDFLVLAIGQNADDTYQKLHERGVQLGPKPFAMGLRLEHPQSLINQIQYGKWQHPDLPPADYFITAKVARPERSVYTFCMCPGGQVIGCSPEPGGVITNGMSRPVRDGAHGNSAVVVNVSPADFSGTPQEPLQGLAFRRHWEERAFVLGGGNYCAPAQRLTDFLQGRESATLVPASFRPGVKAALLSEVLPVFVTAALQDGLRQFNGKMPGFVTAEAILIGVETRTSSPVRILRDAEGQSVNTVGIYPCGEGAGYAGGIISSSLDGIRVADSLVSSLE
ncbi:MAG: FAD-dependent oxidoreductase, partial [Syntrophales bacterium LBB04]|nr:FAD-dependent oxidoreductase [Syntrophales bacterium LBB04]